MRRPGVVALFIPGGTMRQGCMTQVRDWRTDETSHPPAPSSHTLSLSDPRQSLAPRPSYPLRATRTGISYAIPTPPRDGQVHVRRPTRPPHSARRARHHGCFICKPAGQPERRRQRLRRFPAKHSRHPTSSPVFLTTHLRRLTGLGCALLTLMVANAGGGETPSQHGLRLSARSLR